MGFISDIEEVIRWFKARQRAKMDAWLELIREDTDQQKKKKKKKKKKKGKK